MDHLYKVSIQLLELGEGEVVYFSKLFRLQLVFFHLRHDRLWRILIELNVGQLVFTYLQITANAVPDSLKAPIQLQRLVGVTSHAYDETDCAAKGGVDTRVDHYLTWIDEQMRSRCEDGTRVWCEVEGIIPPPTEEEGKGGCGCASAPNPTSAGLWGLLALALVGLRRRNFSSQQA